MVRACRNGIRKRGSRGLLVQELFEAREYRKMSQRTFPIAKIIHVCQSCSKLLTFDILNVVKMHFKCMVYDWKLKIHFF